MYPGGDYICNSAGNLKSCFYGQRTGRAGFERQWNVEIIERRKFDQKIMKKSYIRNPTCTSVKMTSKPNALRTDLNLPELMLSPGRRCRNWVEYQDILLVSAELLGLRKKTIPINAETGFRTFQLVMRSEIRVRTFNLQLPWPSWHI